MNSLSARSQLTKSPKAPEPPPRGPRWLAGILFAGIMAALGGGAALSLRDATPGGDDACANPTKKTEERPNTEFEHGHDLDETKSRVRRLEQQIAILAAALRSRTAQAETGSVNPSDQEGVERADTGGVADPVFEAAVADIMEREHEKQKSERVASARQLSVTMSEELVELAGGELKLNSQQKATFTEIFKDFLAKAYTSSINADPSGQSQLPWERSGSGPDMDELWGEANEKMAAILSPDQYKAYDHLHVTNTLEAIRRKLRANPGENVAATLMYETE